MGLFNNVGDQHTRPGPRGPPGPPGSGFKEDKDGNFDVEDKKLVRVKRCTGDDDAVNKKYVDDILTGVGNLANIGRWVGRLAGVGNSVDLGFDTSKGQLFNFEMRVGTSLIDLTITRICQQNETVVLMPWINLATSREYSIGVSLSGR